MRNKKISYDTLNRWKGGRLVRYCVWMTLRNANSITLPKIDYEWMKNFVCAEGKSFYCYKILLLLLQAEH